MNMDKRLLLLNSIDEELLEGGVVLSEWCSFIIQETDIAFINGAHLATIFTAIAGIETHLRSESIAKGRNRLVQLVESSLTSNDLKEDIHKLRKYRNRWVHVEEPWLDEALIGDAPAIKQELEDMAFFAVRTLRKTIYADQWI
ncbi:hypothetical protein J2732_001201 [Achromobacter deleyi]|uniref:hypothetical protein n=1 Tax=Achromobacter deleyi TaxID=1353891 RepID=UPI0028591D82|nr:hypothetical protein [Achromobacter deleyi]MDR6600218.1 hypothetical protein [Achromobacter deleyi]